MIALEQQQLQMNRNCFIFDETSANSIVAIVLIVTSIELLLHEAKAVQNGFVGGNKQQMIRAW